MRSRRATAIFVVAGMVAGCHGELYTIGDNPAPGDGGASDAAGADAAPIGPVFFVPTIQNDLDALGCSMAGQCHGGGNTPMRLAAHPDAEALLRANYNQVTPRAASDASSPLLLKALLGSGSAHAGPQPLSSTRDPIYQRWLAWIRSGAPYAPPAGDGGM